MADSIEIPIKLNGLAQIKSELRELKGELANATDPEQMQQLAQRAGELSDKLKDANEAVANFATGSKFESIGNQFGSMKDSLMSLDFEEASGKAKMFSKSLTSINPSDIGNSIKGLISTVATLGKAFITFGLQLLANPIFLLVAAIVAVVVGIVLLMNKLGLIKPILDAISAVFKAIVQGLKDFADWLGITNFAAEDGAKKQIDAQKKVAEAYKNKGEKIGKTYDRQIEIAKIEGKTTTQMELGKQNAIIATAELRQKALMAQIKANAISHSMEADELKAVYAGIKETNNIISSGKHQIQVINATAAADKKKKSEEDAKTDKENANKSAKERSESAIKRKQQQDEYNKQRIETARQIEDLNLSLMKDGITKELKSNEIKYTRLKEDNAKNSKLTAEERKKIDVVYQQQEFNEKKAINNKYDEEIKANLKAKQKVKTDEKLKLADEETKRLDAQKLLKAEIGKTEEEIALQKIRDEYAAKRLIAVGDTLLTIQLNKDEKLKLAEVNDKFRKEEEDKEKAKNEFRFKATKDTLSLIGDVAAAFAGKSKEQQKKAFNVQKASNLAIAGMETWKAAQSAFASQIIPGDPTSVVRASIVAGLAVAQGLLNVKKIASQQFEGGGASGGGAGGAISLPAMSPNTSTFASNNGTANNLNSTNNGIQQPEQIIKAIVVESDITNSQNKMNKIKESATL